MRNLGRGAEGGGRRGVEGLDREVVKSLGRQVGGVGDDGCVFDFGAGTAGEGGQCIFQVVIGADSAKRQAPSKTRRDTTIGLAIG
jgi:hypothetical protein